MHFCIVLRVKVAVVLGNADVDFASGFKVNLFQFRRFVVAFGAPGDVVGVAEGVDVKNIDVRRCKEEVLDELSLH